MINKISFDEVWDSFAKSLYLHHRKQLTEYGPNVTELIAAMMRSMVDAINENLKEAGDD